MANILAAWTANVVLTSAVQCPCATATLPELKVPEQVVCVCVFVQCNWILENYGVRFWEQERGDCLKRATSSETGSSAILRYMSPK